MADYVSALNGQQMDAALMDMALHNSEAWAVGTRNGYEVESDDITWENNAKYYASVAGESSTTATTAASSASESASTASSAATAAASDATRAEDAADRAEAIVGGQFVSYGQTQGLTDAQKLQARANISAGASNRNLLDNPWWGSGEVVNQRQITAKPSSNGAYCIDRWTWNSGADANNMSLGANGITFTRSASNIWFAQKMANPSALVGKKITGSVMLSDGTIKSGSVVYASVGSTPTLYQDSAVQIYISSVGAFSLTIKTTQTIRAVKLELGSYSTLANDVPPNYAEEEFRSITSTADPTDLYANTGFGRSNRNLLDNPFFTIHQKGTGGVTGVGYAVDRWKNTGGANLTQTPRSPYGITFASSSGYQVDQALWDYPAEYLDGETLTISVMTSGKNIAQATGVFTATSSTAAKVAVTSMDGNFTVGLYYNTSARAVPFVRITTPTAKSPVNAAIFAVKLEKGSYSTLANDVPPDYAEELDKCLYYFERVAPSPQSHVTLGWGYSEGNATTYFSTKMHPKRTQPTISAYSLVVSGTNSMNISTTGLSIYSWSATGHTTIRFLAAANSFTSGNLYRCGILNGGFIDFSSDL